MNTLVLAKCNRVFSVEPMPTCFNFKRSAWFRSKTAEKDVSENKTETPKITVMFDDNVTQDENLDIDKIRDKSRLKPEHRNILFDKKPFTQPMTQAHLTVKYNRKMYGRYGSESGVNPGIMWPTKSDVESRREYEKIAYPFTIQEMVKAAEEEIKIQELNDQRTQERVLSNLAKLDAWKKALQENIAKKEAVARAAKEKKEKLIEEVRRHFGFKVDPRDERFRDMLAKKEKEETKKAKQARIDEKEKKAISFLMEKHKENITESKEPDDSR